MLRFCSCSLRSNSCQKYLLSSVTSLESVLSRRWSDAFGSQTLSVLCCPCNWFSFHQEKTKNLYKNLHDLLPLLISSLISSSTALLLASSALASLVSLLSLNTPDKTELSSQEISMVCTLTFVQSLLKWHLLTEAYSDHPICSSSLHTTPRHMFPLPLPSSLFLSYSVSLHNVYTFIVKVWLSLLQCKLYEGGKYLLSFYPKYPE